MLINMVTEGGTWAAHGVRADQVLARVALIEDGSPSLGAYARDMIESALDRGILAPPGGGPPTAPR
jgi:putative hydrolase of HD superfamily